MLLKTERLNCALKALSETASLFVPARRDDGDDIKFALWNDKVQPDFSKNSIIPPKDLLFPQSECLYQFTQNGEDTAITESAAPLPMIVFGIRPCDVQSIGCMDDVFLTHGYTDTLYERRREQLTTVAFGCENSEDTCFCGSMGGSPNAAPLADVMMFKTPRGFSLTSQSIKGEKFLVAIGSFLEDEKIAPAPNTECVLKVDIEGVAEKLSEMFESPLWDEISRPCLGCGICTFICPTCYCFDMNQEMQGNEGTAFRCWDSCMFSDYTRMAGGANPRPSKLERVRNRYMHKLCFFNERYGKTLCVGCGRCLKKCPVGMNITEVIRRVKKECTNE
ncbi:MAG: 4Fe-4S dicluster domain-containing protein [Oscillospiraceae bacterium]